MEDEGGAWHRANKKTPRYFRLINMHFIVWVNRTALWGRIIIARGSPGCNLCGV